MSGYYYQTNKDIANSFLEDNLHKVTQEQIKKVMSLMKNGQTDFVKHNVEKGGKQLSLELSDEPMGRYEKYDVIIETVGIKKEIIKPSGNVITETIKEIQL